MDTKSTVGSWWRGSGQAGWRPVGVSSGAAATASLHVAGNIEKMVVSSVSVRLLLDVEIIAAAPVEMDDTAFLPVDGEALRAEDAVLVGVAVFVFQGDVEGLHALTLAGVLGSGESCPWSLAGYVSCGTESVFYSDDAAACGESVNFLVLRLFALAHLAALALFAPVYVAPVSGAAAERAAALATLAAAGLAAR